MCKWMTEDGKCKLSHIETGTYWSPPLSDCDAEDNACLYYEEEDACTTDPV